MSRESELTIGVVLVIAMGCGVSIAAAQTDRYPRMAAISQYSDGKKDPRFNWLPAAAVLSICSNKLTAACIQVRLEEMGISLSRFLEARFALVLGYR
jgi:hypothetical protein